MEYCCEALQQIVEDWDGPFSWPISINPETHDLECRAIAVSLYNLTSSKKAIARAGRARVYLDFCPMCGAKLLEIES